MIEADRALVIVPTFNEAATIEEVMRRLFESLPESADVLVVDDSSPDGTADLVRALAAEQPRTNLLVRAEKTGLGRAYIDGFRWGLKRSYSAIVEMDADLSHDPAAVPRLLAALADAELVIGSRYVPLGEVRNWGRGRLALSRGGNAYARRLLRIGVKDATSGFRAFRAEALASQDLDTVASHGYAFQIEMVRRIQQSGGRIVEIPIVFTERSAGRSKMSRRIVIEALWQVTTWGLGDRLRRR